MVTSPPLAAIVSPVSQRASSLARKATTSAMSSGSPSRPSAVQGGTASGQVWPAILVLKNNETVILSGIRIEAGKEEIVVRDPLKYELGFQFWDRERTEREWAGAIILTKRKFALTDAAQPFSLKWFIPEFLRQRSALTDIVAAALTLRFSGWGWNLLNGLISLLLGVMIFRQWPMSGEWVIGLFVGIDLLFAGFTWIMLALGLRQVSKLRPHTPVV